MFLLGFVAALICIVSPVSLDPVTTFRDIFFLLLTCIWLALAFHDEKFTYIEAVGEDWERPSCFNDCLMRDCNCVFYIPGALILYGIYLVFVIAQHFMERGRVVEVLSTAHTINREDSEFRYANHRNENLFTEFLIALNPFDVDEWNSSTSFGRISEVLKVCEQSLVVIWFWGI